MNIGRRGFLKVLGGLAVAGVAPIRAALGSVPAPKPEAPDVITATEVNYRIANLHANPPVVFCDVVDEDCIVDVKLAPCEVNYSTSLAEVFVKHFDDEMIRLANQGSCLVRVPKELKRS